MNEPFNSQNTHQSLQESILATLLSKHIPILDAVGRAIRISVMSISDVNERLPKRIAHYGSMEMYEKDLVYFGICRNGDILNSPQAEHCQTSDWDHVGNQEKKGIPLGAAWKNRLQDIEYVVECSTGSSVKPDDNYQEISCHFITDTFSTEEQQKILERWGVEIPLTH